MSGGWGSVNRPGSGDGHGGGGGGGGSPYGGLSAIEAALRVSGGAFRSGAAETAAAAAVYRGACHARTSSAGGGGAEEGCGKGRGISKGAEEGGKGSLGSAGEGGGVGSFASGSEGVSSEGAQEDSVQKKDAMPHAAPCGPTQGAPAAGGREGTQPPPPPSKLPQAHSSSTPHPLTKPLAHTTPVPEPPLHPKKPHSSTASVCVLGSTSSPAQWSRFLKASAADLPLKALGSHA